MTDSHSRYLKGGVQFVIHEVALGIVQRTKQQKATEQTNPGRAQLLLFAHLKGGREYNTNTSRPGWTPGLATTLGPAGTHHGVVSQAWGPGRSCALGSGQGDSVGAHGGTRDTYGSWCPGRQLQTSLTLPVLLCGKTVGLSAGEKESWLLELVQTHLLSFVVMVGDSDAKKGNI